MTLNGCQRRFQGHAIIRRLISQKPYKIDTWLLQTFDRKWYVAYLNCAFTNDLDPPSRYFIDVARFIHVLFVCLCVTTLACRVHCVNLAIWLLYVSKLTYLLTYLLTYMIGPIPNLNFPVTHRKSRRSNEGRRCWWSRGTCDGHFSYWERFHRLCLKNTAYIM